jgi:hypothetical protein
MTTLTIMRILPREVDPMVYNMSLEDPGSVSFAGIGGLGDQVRELREVIELPLMNPELFEVSSVITPALTTSVLVSNHQRVYFCMVHQEQEKHCLQEQWPQL